MSRCFVIQPFDNARFDKRYEDVFEPAIRRSGLEPYRVDRDPSVVIPIDQIEAGIRTADACLADISTDNPNVWYELGFAFAMQKPVVLVCSSERGGAFPFDVQHRSVLRYQSESTRDFTDLGNEIAKRLAAILSKEQQLARLSEPTSRIQATKGLDPHEIVALIILMENRLEPGSAQSGWSIYEDMEKAGFTKVAATLALETLTRKGLIATERREESYGEPYMGYLLTSSGLDWIISNKDRISLRQPKDSAGSEAPAVSYDDDVPF